MGEESRALPWERGMIKQVSDKHWYSCKVDGEWLFKLFLILDLKVSDRGVEAQSRQKIFLPVSRQWAVEIITSGWVWGAAVRLEICWKHLWKRHESRLLKSMTQEVPSHNLCRWLLILGRLIMHWACFVLPEAFSAGCWQSTQRDGCSSWASVLPYVFLGRRQRGSWKHLAGSSEPSASWTTLPERTEGSWFGEKETLQKVDLDWILYLYFFIDWLQISVGCLEFLQSSCSLFSASK